MATNPTKHRGGKPRKFVVGQDGKTIHGLSLHKKSGRYYAIGTDGKREYFGRDLSEAIYRFQRWQEEQDPDGATKFKITVPMSVPLQDVEQPDGSWDEYRRLATMPEADLSDDQRTTLSAWMQYEKSLSGLADKTDRDGRVTIDSVGWSWIWAEVRKMLLEDPDGLNRKVGLTVKVIDKPDDSPSLAVLRDTYENLSKAKAKTKRDVLRNWDTFAEFVEADLISEVSAKQVSAWGVSLEAEQKKRKLSPSWLKARFESVLFVLRLGVRKLQDRNPEAIEAVVGYCKAWDVPANNGKDPHPIDKEHFLKLLDATDEKWEAILLMSLNCALYPSEVANVHKDEIKQHQGQWVFVSNRTKTGIARCAVLWDRTIKAIEKHQESHPNQSPYLFVNKAGKKYQGHKLAAYVREHFTKPLDLFPAVSFDHIRDGAATVAANAASTKMFDSRQEQILMGQRAAGVTDDYAKRHPLIVADACKAIESEYFPDDITAKAESEPMPEEMVPNKG